MIKINEIFYSIQGESSLVGTPTVFVRTSGCHLRCTYCDTTYAYHEGQKMTSQDIFEKIKTFPTKQVCLTGGEPLLQKGIYDLLNLLIDSGYHISVETSGDLDCHLLPKVVKKIIDIKTPDSGAPNAIEYKNLLFNDDPETEFKFVICSEADCMWAFNFVKEHDLTKRAQVYFSPSHGKIAPNWLAEEILKNNSKVRLQLQLHKYIWSEHKRGV